MKTDTKPHWRCLMDAAETLGDEFTPEELTVQAWRLYPDQFAMDGFEEYPDHYRCVGLLNGGANGLFRRGLVKRTRSGKLEVVKPWVPERIAWIDAHPNLEVVRYAEAVTFWGGESASALKVFDASLFALDESPEQRLIAATDGRLREKFAAMLRLNGVR